MTNAAPWLKAMENGGLGEARAKAFLMDRFWVLERSVDVDGADYLVQRRLTAKNFMDRDPPRLGIVQVKFIQDGNTSISIDKSYVCDLSGHPYGEFFLLVFSGREDHEKSYLLSSSDIKQEFSENVDGERTTLRVTGSKLMATSNYEILQKKPALDRIEHALINADFMANRRFLGVTNYIEISPDHIDEDFLVPLDNNYGDIRKIFFKEKKKLRSTLFDMEAVVDAIQKVLRTTDPEDAMRLYEEEIVDYVGGSGFRRTLSFSCDVFDDDDFYEAVKNHKARLAKLRALGIEGSYLKLLNQFEKALTNKFVTDVFNETMRSIRVSVTYDPENLRGGTIRVVARDNDETEPRVAISRKGKQVIYYGVKNSLPREAFDTSVDTNARAIIVKNHIWKFRRPFQSALDTLLLGDDLVAF